MSAMCTENELLLAIVISLIFVWFFREIPHENIFVPT